MELQKLPKLKASFGLLTVAFCLSIPLLSLTWLQRFVVTPPGFFALFSKIHSDSPLVFAQPRSFKSHVHYLARPSRLAMLLSYVNFFAVIKLAAAVFSDTSWLFRSLSKIHSDSPLVFAQPRSFKSHVHYLARPSRLAMLLFCEFLCCH